MQKYAKKMNWVYPNTFVVIIYLEYYKGCIDDYWYSITHWADGNQLGIGARDKCWAIDFTKICNSLRLPQRRYLLFKNFAKTDINADDINTDIETMNKDIVMGAIYGE